MQIVNFFYQLAREHKGINGFIYDKSYQKGAGNSKYPLMWLDDPITGSQQNADGAVISWTVNLDVLGIPATSEGVNAVQSAAFDAGLSTIERIKNIRPLTGFSIATFNFVTLRDYYDDNAAGIRFTITLRQANPVNRCADDFDPSKQFPDVKALPDFNVDNPSGCAVFNTGTGLPDFTFPTT